MNYKILFYSLLLAYNVCGQSNITADIVQLSKLTFNNSPAIKRNALTVNSAEGNFKTQKGAFDYQIVSSISLIRDQFNPFDIDPINNYLSIGKLKSRGTSISLELQKKHRTGLSTNLSIDYSLDNNNYLINNFGESVNPFIADHNVSATFSLTQPLLRGNNKKVTTAQEQQSIINLKNAKNNSRFANSYELYSLGISYWQYVTAFKSLKIYKENETRVKRVLEVTQELVKADKKPKGDLIQIQADLASQERQTRIAQQTLYSSKLNLGRVVGFNEDESKKINIPINEFPEIKESGIDSSYNKTKLIELAQKNRLDIEAAKRTQEALALQTNLASNYKKPQLDLTGYINYGGMNMGNGLDVALTSFIRNQGRNVGFGFSLNFSLPINNNQAKGNYIQSKAILEDQEISNKNLQRNINLNVSIAFEAINTSIATLEKTKKSLDFYQKVYDNEQVKFQNGLTTLLNLILFQERLTFAQLEYLQAHQQFAIAILNLRYETGSLVATQSNKEIEGISRASFYTIPK